MRKKEEKQDNRKDKKKINMGEDYKGRRRMKKKKESNENR